MGTEEISYQNKDITSKFLAEHLKGKTFRVYGLDLPEITDVKPTNLPTIRANELRMDNLFELADGTVAVVDYESAYDSADKVKYLNYLTGIANRYQTEGEPCPTLRMVVIYTGDIRRESVSCHYSIGALQMEIEAAFLSELDAEGILPNLKEKVKRGELLSDEELMEFIIIDQETAKRIRRAIEMTQVARIFEEEKLEAVKRTREQVAEQITEQIVIKMLKRGDTPEEIAFVVPNYSLEDVEAVRAKLVGAED